MKKQGKRNSLALLMLVAVLWIPGFAQTTDRDIEHVVVYKEKGKYGGWPANHGIWVWGNEILVGFVKADFKERQPGLHTYDPTTARNFYARSYDGGNNWELEEASTLGQTGWGHDNNLPESVAESPTPLSSSISDFTDPGFILTFLRHNNHDGPSHFYYSMNKGKAWSGPYTFPNMGSPGLATRTDYHVEAPHELAAFVTSAKTNNKEGKVGFSRTKDGGKTWDLVSWITPEQGGFDIMPSSIKLSGQQWITFIRTRYENGQNLISSYLSKDDGLTWSRLIDPAPDTGRGGSPPAAVMLKDGRIALGYFHRSNYGSRVHVRFSDDEGKSWGDEIILRSGDGANRDVGYPRMVQREDGKLVIVYYWNNSLDPTQDPVRYIAATIFDPEDY